VVLEVLTVVDVIDAYVSKKVRREGILQVDIDHEIG
jgi:hypothetical protein